MNQHWNIIINQIHSSHLKVLFLWWTLLWFLPNASVMYQLSPYLTEQFHWPKKSLLHLFISQGGKKGKYIFSEGAPTCKKEWGRVGKIFLLVFYLFHKIVKMQYSTVMKGAGSVSDWVEEKTSPFTYLH